MTRDIDDDLAALKAALKAAPATDPAAKTMALARAMAAFEENATAPQGMARAPRPNQDRPNGAGFLKGLHAMISRMGLRPVLAATTSVAALAVGAMIFLPQLRAPLPDPSRAALPVQTEAVQVEEAQDSIAQIAVTESASGPALTAAAPEPAPAPAAKARTEARAAAPVGAMIAESHVMAEPAMIAPTIAPPMITGDETFANAEANPVKSVAQEPVSTFSADVDTASYAIIRNDLNAGRLPDPEAVRVEEMVNYFPYAYPAPAPGAAPFQPVLTVMPTPWNSGTQLVRIGLQGRLPAIADRPALNLVFLVDTSGSMDDPAKLPLLRQSLALVLPELRPEDQVAIVAYAGSAGEVLPPTPAAERATILDALDRLEAGGSTAGAEGLELAYRIAERMTGTGEVGRVLLATDGDFNVGIHDPDALEGFIKTKAATGVYLSVLGFGRGNLDDATMQALAQNGNGLAAYIDTLQEARKVLVDQLTGALFPIAGDVKIQVEWNPARVAEYRLIGYETRALRREDFNNDRVDAGEIGAGHQVTALYEVTAPGSPAILNDPLRYGTATDSIAPAPMGEELGLLRLRYKAPGESRSALIETAIPVTTAPDTDAAFAAAIAGFGQLLRGSDYLGDWGWDQAIALAEANRGSDSFGYRIEAVNLMRLAQSLSL